MSPIIPPYVMSDLHNAPRSIRLGAYANTSSSNTQSERDRRAYVSGSAAKCNAPPGYVTIVEAAETINRHSSQVRRIMARYQVPSVKLTPHHRCPVVFVDLQRLLDAFNHP